MKTQSRSRMQLLDQKVLENEVISANMIPQNANHFFPSENVLTVIDIFSSRLETRNAILELRQQGLPSSQIVVITQNYQEYENSINWEYVTKDGNLLGILTGFGVDALDIPRFENAVRDGNFLVAAIMMNQSVYHAQHLLQNIGRRVISVY
jgi:hypothetical protein